MDGWMDGWVHVHMHMQGVGDQVEVLQLRVQQLGTSLAQLSAAHQETVEKLAAWQCTPRVAEWRCVGW